MRSSIFKIFSIGVVIATLFGSCSSDNQAETNFEVPIELSATMDNMSVLQETRKPLDGFNNTPVVFANRLDSNPYSDFWNAKISVQGYVVFVPQRIYNMDNKTHHVRGFYPRPATAPVAEVAVYDIDGNSDIMASNEVDLGSLNNKTALPFVTFKHLLTQFRFCISNDGTAPYEAGKKIREISISTTNPQGLAQKAHLNLATGAITYSDYVQEVVVYQWSASNDLSVPSRGVVRNDVIVTMFEPNKEMKVTVTYEDEDVSNPDKVKTFTLDLSSANATLATEALSGYSYKVTLSFRGVALHMIPNLATWETGKINNNNDDFVSIW